MRYKIINPALESLDVGGNPVVTTATLPSGDLNLSPSTSIPIEQSDLAEFCAKTGELAGQIQSAEETAIVLEGIAARLDESSNKAEARATRYAMECLCESVGINKADLKGNEEGADPGAADKISIVLENISESLKKIWAAIRDGLRVIGKWIKEFLGGVRKRLQERKKTFHTFEKAYKDYLENVAKGNKFTFNDKPIHLSPAEFRLLSGGIGTQTEQPGKYLTSVFASVELISQTLAVAGESLMKMVEVAEKGSSAGLVFDYFPVIKKLSFTEVELAKGVDRSFSTSDFCSVYKGHDIGNTYTTFYILPRDEVDYKDAGEMADAVRSSGIRFVPTERSVKDGPLTISDSTEFNSALEAITELTGMSERFAAGMEEVSGIIDLLEKIADKRVSESGDASDSVMFSACVTSVTGLIISPATIIINFIDKTNDAAKKYLEHALHVA